MGTMSIKTGRKTKAEMAGPGGGGFKGDGSEKLEREREKCKERRLWNEITKQAKTHSGL
jgi:50S ribosomal subunit-associated GTPase HflX